MKPWEKYAKTDAKPWEKHGNKVDPKASIKRRSEFLTRPKAFDFETMVNNIYPSGKQLLEDITYPIRHPVDFAEGVTNLAKGGYEKFTPGVQEHEKYIDGVGDFYAKRYGSLENTKQTLMNDPAGLFSDAISVASLGGGLLGKVPGIVGKTGKKVSKASMAVDPVNAAFNIAKHGVGLITPKNLPASMYENVAKLSYHLDKPKKHLSRDATDFMLDNQIPPTDKGFAKFEGLKFDTGNLIDQLIEESKVIGTPVPASRLLAGLDDLRKDLGSDLRADGIGNLDKINNQAEKLTLNQQRLGRDSYSIYELQELKKNLYKDVSADAYLDKGKELTPENQTKKNIAHQAMSEIEKQIPEIHDANALYGQLMDYRYPLMKSAQRVERNNRFSMGGDIKTSAAGSAFGKWGARVMAAYNVLDNPKSRANLALWLHKIKSQGLLNNVTENNLPSFAARRGLLELNQNINDQPKP